jgi:photosystem II PsbZ protein
LDRFCGKIGSIRVVSVLRQPLDILRTCFYIDPLVDWEKTMVFIFDMALLALVVLSFILIVGVPVAYASGQNWDQSKRLIWLGSFVWIGLVLVVASLNFLVA